jgi:predicted metal-dependent hydrolase
MRVTEKKIAVGSDVFECRVLESSRTRARLVVCPTGDIEVRVPKGTPESWVSEFVRRRARWIIRQRDYFDTFRPYEPQCEYRNGETLRYLGRQYRLKVEVSREKTVRLRGRYLVVTAPDSQRGTVREQVEYWFRSRSEQAIQRRVDECMKVMSRHGIIRPAIQMRPMKRRWGSCTAKGRVLLNPYLAIAPIDCIDYVITHELCHLRHPYHDRFFYQLLTMAMPDWKKRRQRLERIGSHVRT